MKPRVAIVVPWRAGVAERETAWRWCRAWWERFGWPIFEVEHAGPEPFNRAWTINEGARRAWPWDVLVAIDADTFEADPEQVVRGVTLGHSTGRLTIPHTSGHDLSRVGTRRLLSGQENWDRGLAKRRPVCTSRVWIMRRDLFAEVGGFDERFRGWGHEDVAAFAAMRTLRGVEQLPGIAYHLWHEPSFPTARYTREWKAGKALAERYLQADPQGWPALEPILRERRDTHRWVLPPTEAPLGASVRAEDPIARRVDVMVMTAGRREYLERTMDSFMRRVTAHWGHQTIYDDSGDPEFGIWLKQTYPEWEIVTLPGLSGFTNAIRTAWMHEQRRSDGSPFIFHLEEDFVFDRAVHLDELIGVLGSERKLAQMALLRGPFFEPEIAAGGIVEEDPQAYTHRVTGKHPWMEHSKYFTTNPSVYSRDIMAYGWPGVRNSEVAFTRVMSRRGFRFGMWGDGEPWISHIGVERTGIGY